ncbi:MAG TPA: LPS export ABC transporter permease LptF [Terriglobales bacterium]|nr:LPS export ABC transporter permease LptF [Terriglobales bacterium]
MRILDRYVLREIAVPFLLGLGLFTLVLLVARIVKIIEMIVNRGVAAADVLLLFSYILPGFLEVTVPMALLFAALIAFGRLAADSELTALRAAGISLVRISRPVFLFALAAFGLTLMLSLHVRPWANALLRNGIYELAKSRASAAIRPRVFSDEFAGMVLYVDRVDPPGNVLRGLLISGNLPDDSSSKSIASSADGKSVIMAKSGLLVPDEASQVLRLRLFEGSVHALDSSAGAYQRTDFGTFDIQLDLALALSAARRKPKEPGEMSLSELRAAIATKTESEAPLEAIEYYRRLAIPFACFGFAAIAVPLGLRSGGNVRSRSLAISLAVILGYYLLLTLGESLAERGYAGAALGLWLPNAALAGLAIALFHSSSREHAPLHRGEIHRGWGAWLRSAWAQRSAG